VKEGVLMLAIFRGSYGEWGVRSTASALQRAECGWRRVVHITAATCILGELIEEM